MQQLKVMIRSISYFPKMRYYDEIIRLSFSENDVLRLFHKRKYSVHVLKNIND